MSPESSIAFHYQDVDVPSLNEEVVRKLVVDTIVAENAEPGTLQIIFCDDEYLLEMNQAYLQHDTFTDIITFDYCQDLEGISGDIFISIPRVMENAKKYSVSFMEELHRVILHGILHLLGYKDHTRDEKEVMRSKENYYLTLLS